MFIRNVPLGAKVALCVANEAVRQLELLEQPELFLENHQMLFGDCGDASFSVLTTYSTFMRENRINVVTRMGRAKSGWGIETIEGTVTVEVIKGRTTERARENLTRNMPFRLTWERQTGFLDDGVFHYPRIALLK